MPALATRMKRLGTEGAFEVLARARALEAQGRRVVHLEIGEPDFETAPNIVAAGKRALDEGHTHYGPSAGLLPARETIARYVASTRGIAVSPDQVVITPGAKPILTFTIMATVNEGDEVLIPDPGFPIYESVVRFVGATPVSMPLLQERDFRFDPDDLRRRVTARTKLIVLNSPQNPTGGVLAPEDLQAVADVARERDVWVLSDEIYSRLLYQGEHHSIASIEGMAERTVILDGYSKTYAMTGWRLGYGVAPAALAPQLARLQTNVTSCTASFVQVAGIEALQGPQDAVDSMLDEFRQRRAMVVAGLNQIDGVRCLAPAGAFYAFPRVHIDGLTSKQIADSLLQEEGVALLAGSDFGRHGEGFLRLSFANSMSELDEGLARIKRGIERLRGQRSAR